MPPPSAPALPSAGAIAIAIAKRKRTQEAVGREGEGEDEGGDEDVHLSSISSPQLVPRQAEINACHALLGKLCQDARLPRALRQAAKHQYYRAYARGGTLALFTAYPNPDEEALLEFKGSARHDDTAWTLKKATKAAVANANYFAHALNWCILDAGGDGDGGLGGADVAFDPKMVLGVHDATSRMHGVVLPNDDVEDVGESHAVAAGSSSTAQGQHAAAVVHHAVAQCLKQGTGLECGWHQHLKVHSDILWAPSQLQSNQRVIITLVLDAASVLKLAREHRHRHRHHHHLSLIHI